MVKKDYHEKDVVNHLFLRKRQEKRPKTLRSRITLILLFLTILAWLGFIFYIPYFTIKNLDFSGTDKSLAEKIDITFKGELESRKFFILNKSNYFVFNEVNFKQKLEDMFMLSELEIVKKFPNIIAIKAEEKTTSLVVIVNNDAYFVDYNGMVIDVLKDTEKLFSFDTSGTSNTAGTPKIAILENNASQIPQVELKNTTGAINARINVFNGDQVSTILEIYEKLNKEGIMIINFILDDAQDTKITTKTKEGFLIYFTSEDTIQNQIDNLKIILREKIGDNRSNLQYIDLRFGDKVYYK